MTTCSSGKVLFDALDANRTKITLKLEADPDGTIETIGVNLGILEG